MFRLGSRYAARLGVRSRVTLAEREAAPTINDVHVFNGQDQTALKQKQAPNRKETWAPTQRPREDAMTGPRFDGIDLSTQPMPEAAIDLIAKSPVHYVHGTAVCDGNIGGIRGGVQGHPKVYINTDKPGMHVCTYCGNRYANEEYKEQIESGEITALHSS